VKRFKITYTDYVHADSESEALEIASRSVNAALLCEHAEVEEVPDDSDE
jgi:hypothetical protein